MIFLVYIDQSFVDKPHFHDFHAFADVKENQSFNITLEASAYPMPITYTWFHPSGRQLFTDQSRIFINQGQLSIIIVQKSDLGVFRCIATNAYGSDEVNFTLNVLCMYNYKEKKQANFRFVFLRWTSYYSNSRLFNIRSSNARFICNTFMCN